MAKWLMFPMRPKIISTDARSNSLTAVRRFRLDLSINASSTNKGANTAKNCWRVVVPRLLAPPKKNSLYPSNALSEVPTICGRL